MEDRRREMGDNQEVGTLFKRPSPRLPAPPFPTPIVHLPTSIMLRRNSHRLRHSPVQQFSRSLESSHSRWIGGDGLNFIKQRHPLIDLLGRQASQVGRCVEMLVAKNYMR